ncbi:hypothetical protein GL325_01850 [Aeromicrobium sp. 636]|uniref:Thioester domain-containing protein n=1 Tax=Aeromicrobium senzhongii TaxID=2663859 RepID=A0A8I0ETD2_9ACTN|nr:MULTISPECIES: thioester domain-containing protein [Aeromicrobium]MBC9225058.1 thioester domain-containing protein [Aeromicrobium senzhongii]MCQ3997169.1 hypothetical protein [Aeromicrobium sp. 636]
MTETSGVTNRGRRGAAGLLVLTLLAGLLFAMTPAQAQPIIGGEDEPFPVGSPFTELQIGPLTGELGVLDVDGYTGPSTFDPVTEGYPAATDVPTTWPTRNDGYAGVIPANDAEGNEVLTYCIDVFTSTQTGIPYERGEWNESNVRNLGYVAYILQNYYPTVPDVPAGVADNVRAGAVQSAIWFFSDSFVLDPDNNPQLFDLTSEIVADAIANGPLAEPAQPDLSVSPQTAQAPASGDLVGPFTVTADGPSTLRLEGVEVFADAAGTQPLAEGATVQPGAQLWTRSASTAASQGFSLQREVPVRESTVYLYDGSIPGRNSAQSLILAENSTIAAVASVRITRVASGGIEVTKTISGDAAGLQSAVEVLVTCTPQGGGPVVERTLTVPAGTAAGSQAETFTGLTTGSSCVVTEPEDGDNGLVVVTATSIEPETVSVVANQTASVAVTNEYARATGGVRVTKTITGEAAGLQGPIEVLLTCTPPDGGAEIQRTLTIPAQSPAGSQSEDFIGLPSESECVATELENGDNDQVSVTATSIEPGTVTVLEGAGTPVTVTNEYARATGGLQVTKTITGDGAGLQGPIEVLVSCTPEGGGTALERTLTIPAGSPAGTVSDTFSGLPVGATCAITEPEDGDNGRVTVTATSIAPETVTIAEGATPAVAVTNDYDATVGGITVTKTISGGGAGLQGPVEILVACTDPEDGSTIEQAVTIAAGTGAGIETTTLTAFPAGSTCTITEPQDGDNGLVSLTASSIDPATVTVVENANEPVAVTNEYARAVGGLQVTKIIGGPAAGEQGEVVLDIDCDDADNAFDQQFTIPAGSLAGGYVETLEGIPAGTNCEVTETATGETDTVVLSTPVTITPGPVTIVEELVGEVVATNTYRTQDQGGDDEEQGGGGGSDYGGYYDDFLASTGGPWGPAWGIGVALLVAGGGALIVHRRRSM